MGRCPPIRWFFLKPPPPRPIKINVPHGTPPLKNEAPHLRKKPSYRKVKPHSRKWVLKKIPEKPETVINTWVSIIKQHWKNMVEILQESDFITWSIQNFVGKVKQFVKKSHITWLTTQLLVIDIVPLTVLFCNCLLIDL